MSGVSKTNANARRNWIWVFHLAAVAAAILLVILGGWRGESLPLRVRAEWIVVLLMLASVPRWPWLGVVVYAALSTLVHRYDAYVTPDRPIPIERPFNVHMLAVVALLAFTGAVANAALARKLHSFFRRPHGLACIMAALMIWLAFTWAVAEFRTDQPIPPQHDPIVFVEAAVLFFLASRFMGGPLQSFTLAAAVCVAITLRCRVLNTSGIYRDEDAASLIVIALPLTLMCILTVRDALADLKLKSRGVEKQLTWAIWFAAGLMILNLLLLVRGSQVRAALVAVAIVAIVMWLISAHKLIGLAIALPVAVVGFFILRGSEFWRRFTDVWTHGPESGSAMERLQLWSAGWDMFRDHLAFGVGPGRFAQYIQFYDPSLPVLPAHNVLVDMAAETGVVGLVLYTVLFAGAIIVLWQISETTRGDWPGPAARTLLGAIAAYLAVGMFYTQHDRVLAYILLGCTVALHRRIAGRED